jgi:exo-beta-1,3-glucanase (GH17 family)
MSSKYNKYMSLTGMNIAHSSRESLQNAVTEVLDNRIHGISFSPYLEGQKPGTIITEEQITARLSVISHNINWVRSFSCTEGNENIPKIAKQQGLKTLVGAWLNDDLENNEKEINNVIEVAKQGYANIVAVGNEVLLRDDLTEQQLIDYINRVKAALPNIEVGYVDAYYEFEEHPNVTEACDVILANCYPFWEGCAIEYSILYMKDMYQRAIKASHGKKVIITETGWPKAGPNEWGAVPSYENAIKYFLGTYQWAEEDNIEVFYFSSFDEVWKVEDEGGVGAHWGLWDKNGKLKYV